MSAYDPFALWLMERERLHRDAEHLRRRSESERHRAARRTTPAQHDALTAGTVSPTGGRGGRGIHRLLPGEA